MYAKMFIIQLILQCGRNDFTVVQNSLFALIQTFKSAHC